MQDDHSDRLIDDALHRLVVLNDPDLAPAARTDALAAADHWRAADPAHEMAWQRATISWQAAMAMTPDLARQRRAGRWAGDRAPRAPSPPRRRLLQGVVAATVVLAAGGYAAMPVRDALGGWTRHATGTGGRRTIRLVDGSTVELGRRTTIRVAIGVHDRQVVLDDGDAVFTVAADAARPFMVRAAGRQVRALGTVFTLSRRDDRATVLVTEHAVAVAGLRVEAGRQVSWSSGGIGAVSAADPARFLAWRRDRLVAEAVPLRAVVAELARHHPGRIVITDAAAGDLVVTAVFDLTAPDAALDSIAASLPVRLRRLGPWLVLISAAG